MNKTIVRNFEVFTPCDFIAAITQHIPDKLQLVRYYGWYSNKMRGQRAKQVDEEVQTEGDAVEVIDVSALEPRRIPSKKWRELIKKVWEVDPLRCPKCSREMRIVSLIDEEDVIERILRHLGLWQEKTHIVVARRPVVVRRHCRVVPRHHHRRVRRRGIRHCGARPICKHLARQRRRAAARLTVAPWRYFPSPVPLFTVSLSPVPEPPGLLTEFVLTVGLWNRPRDTKPPAG